MEPAEIEAILREEWARESAHGNGEIAWRDPAAKE
jgi:hypothetical protein